ncbi:MAG: hypothetical protein WCP20_11315 [Desulfuromonadales bacterium]
MGSFSHILAGFALGFRHRRELGRILKMTPLNARILLLDPKALRASGVAALALDFDGVLTYHGAATPLFEIIDWMKRSEAIFGGDRIFILSNKPTNERIQWFAENFPDMRFIAGIRKKPYPDGLNKTAEYAGVHVSSIMMVDDRLLTGCLAAVVAGARACYIRKPYVSLHLRPFSEIFFMLLRSLERLFVRLISFT